MEYVTVHANHEADEAGGGGGVNNDNNNDTTHSRRPYKADTQPAAPIGIFSPENLRHHIEDIYLKKNLIRVFLRQRHDRITAHQHTDGAGDGVTNNTYILPSRYILLHRHTTVTLYSVSRITQHVTNIAAQGFYPPSPRIIGGLSSVWR